MGTTVRINHDECGDSRRRFYLTTKSAEVSRLTDVVLYYCHNCGLGGVLPIGAGRSPTIKYTKVLGEEEQAVEDSKAGNKLLHNYFHATKMEDVTAPLDNKEVFRYLVPPAYRGFATSMNTIPVAIEHRICWDSKENALLLRQATVSGRDTGSETSALCWRYFDRPFMKSRMVWESDAHSISADPLAAYGPLATGVSYKLADGGIDLNRTVFIVEDLMSGFVLADLDLNCIVLYGTHLSMERAHALSQRYVHAIVWLDNDSSDVNQQATNMVDKLRLFGMSAGRIVNVAEPKTYNRKAIVSAIDDILRGASGIYE